MSAVVLSACRTQVKPDTHLAIHTDSTTQFTNGPKMYINEKQGYLL